MLKILSGLEELAGALDAKGSYKLSDKVEALMGDLMKSSMKKEAQETITELQAPGDPYTYGYDPSSDEFVVTSPKGKGARITKDGPYKASWHKLKARLPDTYKPVASEQQKAEEDEKRAADEGALALAKEIAQKAATGEYKEFLQNSFMHNTKLNWYKTKGVADAREFLDTMERVLKDEGMVNKIHPRNNIWTDIGRLNQMVNYEPSNTLYGRRASKSKEPGELTKEASFDFSSVMEASFHSPVKRPFGR